MTTLMRLVFGLVVVWTLVAIVETAGGSILPRHASLAIPVAGRALAS